LYVLLDPAHGTVRVGNAGHLQPLLITPEGARLVAQEGGLPFGVDPEDREVVDLEIPAGAALVIVTDGLVERRGEDIDEGVARILTMAASVGEVAARVLLSRIVAGASSDRMHDDDVTVLVLRRT